MRHAGQYERVTVAQAAERLGISKPAVRARIRRGTLRADHTADGVRVYVTPGATAGSTADDTSEHIADLRAALEAERQAHGETRRLLAAALERIPALPSGGGTAAQDAAPTTQAGDTGEPRAPWWRRVFGP